MRKSSRAGVVDSPSVERCAVSSLTTSWSSRDPSNTSGASRSALRACGAQRVPQRSHEDAPYGGAFRMGRVRQQIEESVLHATRAQEVDRVE